MKPKIHLTPACNWMNDPVGLIYFKDRYHVFYQYFPYEKQWGTMHWGHAVSDDMVHWEQLPIALYPSKYEDCNGCFSGSAVEHDGKLQLFYTGVRYDELNRENIHCSANGLFTACQMGISSEDGITFDNLKGKQVLIPAFQEPELGSRVNTRDPKVWKDDFGWNMILGSQCEYGGEQMGELLLYRSSDGKQWELKRQHRLPGEYMPECPDLISVDGKWVLLMSLMRKGRLDEPTDLSYGGIVEYDPAAMELHIDLGQFQPLDAGLDIYAAQTMRDADGRTVLFAWIRMPKALEGEPWIGMCTLPRVVEIQDGKLRYHMHPNVKKQFTRECKGDSTLTFPMQIQADLEDGGQIHIGGFLIERRGSKLLTDRSAVFPKESERWVRQTSTRLSKQQCHLEIYADCGVIEIFINHGETVITQVLYHMTDTFQYNKVLNLRCKRIEE